MGNCRDSCGLIISYGHDGEAASKRTGDNAGVAEGRAAVAAEAGAAEEGTGSGQVNQGVRGRCHSYRSDSRFGASSHP